MKHFILSCLATAILLAACNSNKSKDATTSDDAAKDKSSTEMTSETKSDNTAADDVQKKMEELRKLPALSTDQIKAMLPAELMGMKRASFSANSMMGYGIGEARYKSDDGKELKVMIYDCVGEAGVGWYNLMYWGWNMEQEDDNGYTKSTTFNGGKAIEKYEKNREMHSIMFPASNRLLVNVEGEKTGLDAVKQAASSLNLKVD
jgi:ABC-type glycerol-3-phosphate transport system substrate-binding protein